MASFLKGSAAVKLAPLPWNAIPSKANELSKYLIVEEYGEPHGYSKRQLEGMGDGHCIARLGKVDTIWAMEINDVGLCQMYWLKDANEVSLTCLGC